MESLCAIVIAYFPDAGLGERLAEIARQVAALLVVDNGPPGTLRARLRGVPGAERIHLIENAVNRGVATALNQGVRWARARGFAWVALFDQDTQPDPDLVRGLLHVYETHPRADQIGVVGARPHAALDSPEAEPSEATRAWRRCETVISSGSLYRAEVLARVGPFRDAFFIDHVDDDYCLRLAAHGLRVLQTARPLMTHSLGSPRVVRLPWRNTETSNHAALRRYFMTRNHVVLIREHWRSQPRWVLRTVYGRLKSALLMLLFESERAAKLAAMGRGLADGLAGRLGAGRERA